MNDRDLHTRPEVRQRKYPQPIRCATPRIESLAALTVLCRCIWYATLRGRWRYIGLPLDRQHHIASHLRTSVKKLKNATRADDLLVAAISRPSWTGGILLMSKSASSIPGSSVTARSCTRVVCPERDRSAGLGAAALQRHGSYSLPKRAANIGMQRTVHCADR